MDFAYNLLKAIEVENLARTASASLRPPGMGGAVDKEAVRKLAAMLPFEKAVERGMEMYAWRPGEPGGRILVLDNELPIYEGTTVQDVALRRNPVVREMVKIRNMIKILSDKDVVTSRRQDSVDALRSLILKDMDLSFGAEEVEALRQRSSEALKNLDVQGVKEGAAMFIRLLEWPRHPMIKNAPRIMAAGRLDKSDPAHPRVGPSVICIPDEGSLWWLDKTLSPSHKEDQEFFSAAARGERPADASGDAVWSLLAQAAAAKYGLAPGVRKDLKASSGGAG